MCSYVIKNVALLFFSTFKNSKSFFTSVTGPNSERSYITVSFCKRAAFIVVSKRFRAKCRLVFIKHVANSKKIKMYDKFTMFLYIYGQFAVNHEGECSNCYPKKKKGMTIRVMRILCKTCLYQPKI